MSFPEDVELGINRDNIEYSAFMHHQGGNLYGISTTDQVLWLVLIVLKGLSPSLANPSLMLRESPTKPGWHLSNSFHASPSVRCLNFQSLEHSFSCHLNELAIFEV